MTAEEICNQENCTGCAACYNVCPHNAIVMKPDNEGFVHPYIDNEICVDCKLCQITCPIRSLPTLKRPLKVFSGWSNNEEVRLHSSSGGAFVEIARPILDRGGVVFGCGLDKHFQAIHMCVEDMMSLQDILSGSKYVQSNISDTYKQAKDFLKSGRQVLFSGTPCQIAGLRKFLHKDYHNLTTVDIICHGVPSPSLFDDYKKYMENILNMHIEDIKFRCKKSSWIFYNMTLTGHVEKKGGEKQYYGAYFEDPYLRGFLRDNFLRPSCYECKFTRTERVGDFTIADWWGYKKTTKEDKGFRYKGVSLLFVNTEKAVNLLPHVQMYLRPRSIEEAKHTNICLSHPFPMPQTRDRFWKDYREMPFNEIVTKYFYPDKVNWRTYILQHHKNTDYLVNTLNLIYLPMRILKKALNIIKNYHDDKKDKQHN